MVIALPRTADGMSDAPVVGKRQIWLILAGLMIAMILAMLDQSIFGTALPTIVGELHGVEHMAWIATAYILASTVMLPVYGKLGDQIGRKYLFLFAIVVFIGGSVIGGMATSMTGLIVGRAVQGIGGGGLMVLTQAIIADVVPARERGNYTGIMGLAFTVPTVLGPLLGGWFTEGPGWRWVFWMNIPLGLLALASAVLFIPRSSRSSARPQVDYAGIVLLGLVSSAIVLAVSWGGSTYAWDSPVIVLLFLAAAVGAITFVLVERQAADPIMPGRLFRDDNFVLVTIAGLVAGVAMFGAMGYLPTYLQMVTGYDATEAGYQMLPMVAGMLGASVVTMRYVARTGTYMWFPAAGMAVTAMALYALSTMTPGMPMWHVWLHLALLGAGLGMGM